LNAVPSALLLKENDAVCGPFVGLIVLGLFRKVLFHWKQIPPPRVVHLIYQ
jgi:hypothetical protein